MGDFFKQEEPVVPEVPQEPVVPEKIKVGEKEYTQEELSKVVGLGELGQEMETKYNTKIDKVWPEYTRTTQELKALKEEKARAESERLNQRQNQGEQLSDDEIARQARDQARKLGLVTKEDLETYIDTRVSQREEARELLNDCKNYEQEFSGKDGRPAFKTQEILEYMDETGIKNPEKAYKVKYEEQIDSWKEQQIKKAKPSGLYTEESSAAGNKEPREIRPTRDNLDQLVRDALGGNI